MILCDRHLRYALGFSADFELMDATFELEQRGSPLEYGCLKVSPLDKNAIQPSSIDLRLGSEVRRFQHSCVPIRADEGYPDELIPAERLTGSLLLEPGEFVLAHTLETLSIPSVLTARVEGRSSMGRLGVTMHVTAGYIDPGFVGQVTLEIANLSRNHVKIPVGHRVCQLVVETMSGPSGRPYGSEGLGSHYQGQTGASPFSREPKA